MKILLTSDIHGEIADYIWITEHAAEFDLVCVAGDLIDAFDERGMCAQIEKVINWASEMKIIGVPVALCSGNHDAFNSRYDISMPEANKTWAQKLLLESLTEDPNWMQLLSADTVAVDGDTRLFGDSGDELLLTCLPYDFTADYPQLSPDRVWKEAMSLHRGSKLPWLVLHHEPPMDSPVGGCYGSLWIAERLVEASPTYLASGHIHSKPYEKGGSWIDHFEGTWCFNAGRSDRCPLGNPPNHIVLDTKKAIATWHYWDDRTTRMQTQTRSLIPV
jgi:predicted phosphodiesterase